MNAADDITDNNMSSTALHTTQRAREPCSLRSPTTPHFRSPCPR